MVSGSFRMTSGKMGILLLVCVVLRSFLERGLIPRMTELDRNFQGQEAKSITRSPKAPGMRACVIILSPTLTGHFPPSQTKEWV